MASSWNSVLKRMNWMPVWRKISRLRHRAKRLLHDAFGVRVAVVARVAQQRAAAAEQGEVDAPGVDADAVDAAVLGRALRSASSISPYSRSTSQCRVSSVRTGAVGEAVDDLERRAVRRRTGRGGRGRSRPRGRRRAILRRWQVTAWFTLLMARRGRYSGMKHRTMISVFSVSVCVASSLDDYAMARRYVHGAGRRRHRRRGLPRHRQAAAGQPQRQPLPPARPARPHRLINARLWNAGEPLFRSFDDRRLPARQGQGAALPGRAADHPQPPRTRRAEHRSSSADFLPHTEQDVSKLLRAAARDACASSATRTCGPWPSAS